MSVVGRDGLNPIYSSLLNSTRKHCVYSKARNIPLQQSAVLSLALKKKEEILLTVTSDSNRRAVSPIAFSFSHLLGSLECPGATKWQRWSDLLAQRKFRKCLERFRKLYEGEQPLVWVKTIYFEELCPLVKSHKNDQISDWLWLSSYTGKSSNFCCKRLGVRPTLNMQVCTQLFLHFSAWILASSVVICSTACKFIIFSKVYFSPVTEDGREIIPGS